MGESPKRAHEHMGRNWSFSALGWKSQLLSQRADSAAGSGGEQRQRISRLCFWGELSEFTAGFDMVLVQQIHSL